MKELRGKSAFVTGAVGGGIAWRHFRILAGDDRAGQVAAAPGLHRRPA